MNEREKAFQQVRSYLEDWDDASAPVAQIIRRAKARERALESEIERLRGCLSYALERAQQFIEGKNFPNDFHAWLKASQEALAATESEWRCLVAPTNQANEVFDRFRQNNPDADMRAIPNQWLLDERALTARLGAENELMREAGNTLIANSNGDYECDDDERGWLVHDDFVQALRLAIANHEQGKSDAAD